MATTSRTAEPGARTDVLVVSGYLGSGKTTMVRALLEDARRSDTRVAVISNEFGELGIDRALLSRLDDEGYVEIAGGCVCCRLSDQLVETLEDLRRRVRPERILIETSGAALPFDVQINFWRDPVAAWVGDDVAVIVVNAEQLRDERDLDATFEQQVSSADLLVLNKVDLVERAELPRLAGLLREIEPEAPLVHATRGDVDPALLFPPDPDGLRAARRDTDVRPPPHHHEQFEGAELVLPPGLASAEVLERVRGAAALRAKGFVETAEGVRLVQGVGPRVELVEVAAPPDPRLLGRVVVIRRA